MMDWIIQTFFSSVAGWLGVTGMIVVACFAIAWFFPTLRVPMLAIGGAAIAIAAAYTKGNRDRAALEQRRKDEAVAKLKKQYDEIDKRPDTPSDVDKRLKDGTF